MIQNNNTIIKQKCPTKLKHLDFSSILLSIAIIVVMILILVAPTTYAKSVLKGLSIFFKSVLPGLLPFMFLCKLLTKLNCMNFFTKFLEKPANKLFGVNSNGISAFLLSMLSGYPLGARITSDLYSQNQISKTNATKTAILSSTPGAIYVIGAVGGSMLNNTKLGLVIYISCTCSTLITSIIFNLIFKTQTQQQNLNKEIKQKEKNIVVSSVQETVIGLLTVAFYISMFSLTIDLLTNLKVISLLSYPLCLIFGKNANFAINGLISGLIEMTNGAKLLSSIKSSPIIISLIASVISFSGLSIIMQSFNFLSNTSINKIQFIIAKIIQAIISFFICFLICRII